ncbi:DUF1289 domain-containing protein [Pseudomonas syringae]|uniref:DUF1289 domain-containing protein n=1 Tax=Pseudomonas syringae TaxID=317 RepID=A0A9Q3X5X5_PSESX|nr:DUF1289 domain-containing protein [Pseudomonas syringae]MCF5063719.1 DUF1289 domain-containing protein [Pseudomonas syringae]MCF5071767.1 DUF1289 domain-containing protein [Pseudomonas syringae]MCF5380401.1 DUF1289 domain-containing protein [Pseudomonas syringae]
MGLLRSPTRASPLATLIAVHCTGCQRAVDEIKRWMRGRWQAGLCGEPACPRWAAQQPQNLTPWFT